MKENLKVDTLYVIHDSNVKVVTKENEIRIISKNVNTKASKVIIEKMPESQPMITDWLAAIGTILAVILSLAFSGLTWYKSQRKNLVRIKSFHLYNSINANIKSIRMSVQIINESNFPVEINRFYLQYNRQKGPMFPVSFKPVTGKVIVPPMNSTSITCEAYKLIIPDNPMNVKEAICTSFLDLAKETVGYLHQYQHSINNKLKIDKKSFKKVLSNLDVGIFTNLDGETHFRRKLTRIEKKHSIEKIVREIDKVL